MKKWNNGIRKPGNQEKWNNGKRGYEFRVASYKLNSKPETRNSKPETNVLVIP